MNNSRDVCSGMQIAESSYLRAHEQTISALVNVWLFCSRCVCAIDPLVSKMLAATRIARVFAPFNRQVCVSVSGKDSGKIHARLHELSCTSLRSRGSREWHLSMAVAASRFDMFGSDKRVEKPPKNRSCWGDMSDEAVL